MKIAIIGGGLTGLTAGLHLSKNHQVAIFEKNNYLGGLAGSFKQKKWQWPLEFYFHHIFTSDKDIIDLAEELGIKNKLFFLRPKTSVFKNNQIFQFDSAFSLLKFPLLSWKEKFRVATTTAFLKLTNNWQNLEKIPAAIWLERYYGKKPYQLLWEPLLKSKFGPYYQKISASWFWARIKKRSQKLGYFKGGFQVLIDELAEKIRQNGGEIFLNREIKNIKNLQNFDKIIFTGPLPVFLKIAPNLPKNYKQELEKREIIGSAVLILELKEKFLTDDTYWLNINENNFPFVAVVEHTNFIDQKYYGGNHILYVGGYYPQNHLYFKMAKKKIFQEFKPYLKKINPSFNFKLYTLNFELFTNKYAQPIIPPNYSKIIFPFKTPIPNLFFATMHHIYPWDRGTNYAVKLGKEVAYEILKEV